MNASNFITTTEEIRMFIGILYMLAGAIAILYGISINIGRAICHWVQRRYAERPLRKHKAESSSF